MQTNFEVLDSQVASGFKTIINGDFTRRVRIDEEKLHRKKKRVLAGRQAPWMIFEFLKVSDTDEFVLDLNDTLKVGLKNDNEQSFNTR